MSIIYTFALCSAIATFLLLRRLHTLLPPPTPRVHDTVLGIRRLLSSPTGLLERAISNKRLIRAFGLTRSTFISDNSIIHEEFRASAHSIMKPFNGAGWKDWRNIADASAADFLQSHSVSYSHYIQAITFRIILVGLLGAEPEHLVLPEVLEVTSAITELWLRSKRPEPLPAQLLRDINIRLHAWVPSVDRPIELILPAWETMWRVVASAVAHSHGDEKAEGAFQALLRNPSTVVFSHFTEHTPSVQFILAETMRVSPPVRHIHRSVTEAWTSLIYMTPMRRTVVADVETVQLSSMFENPAQFDSMRMHPSQLTDEQRDALLSFGYGSLRCPAAKWAPMAAGIVVAAVLDVFQTNGIELVRGQQMGGREGWEGWKLVRASAVGEPTSTELFD